MPEALVNLKGFWRMESSSQFSAGHTRHYMLDDGARINVKIVNGKVSQVW